MTDEIPVEIITFLGDLSIDDTLYSHSLCALRITFFVLFCLRRYYNDPFIIVGKGIWATDVVIILIILL